MKYSELPSEYYENLGDKEWAQRIYKIAEEEAENYSDYSDLADSIAEKLGDKKWAKKIQDKFNLTDYQMLCISFAKGFVIGALLL